MVLSAKSRNSAGTSSFGSIMLASCPSGRAVPHFQDGVFAAFAWEAGLRRTRGAKTATRSGTQIRLASSLSCIIHPKAGDSHAIQTCHLSPRARIAIGSDGDRIGPDDAAGSRRVE